MNDWKKDTPFPGQWLIYVVLKIAIIALAIYLARARGYI